MGAAPAFAVTDPDVEVTFWHEAPGRWRLDQAGELIAVADASRAVAVAAGRVTEGPWLLVLPGPADLLTPRADWRERRRVPDEGRIEPDERIGRPCWRWQRDDQTWWIDHASGVALAHQSPDGLLEFTALDVDGDVDQRMFEIPDELLDRARQQREQQEIEDKANAQQGQRGWTLGWDDNVDTAGDVAGDVDDERDSHRMTREELEAEKHCSFTVPWWPRGSLTYPEAGDPAVPEALLVLNTGSDIMFWLGVTRAGRKAPTKRSSTVVRWSGDGFEFALSYRHEVNEQDVQRIVASIPGRWEL